MSRKVKFRAFNKKTGQMIDLQAITPLALVIDPTMVKGAGMGVYIPDSDELTIMQYTGKKDKNDKEIYEGDICKFTSPMTRQDISPAVVEWNNEGAYWKLQGKLPLLLHRAIDREIIGNVHENPELLESKT